MRFLKKGHHFVFDFFSTLLLFILLVYTLSKNTHYKLLAVLPSSGRGAVGGG